MEAAYSSAVIHFLDRDDQTIKTGMMYPITRIELKEFRDNAIVTVRIFVVNEQSQWVEWPWPQPEKREDGPCL